MAIPEVAQHLLDGQLVVFPTETVYGLGALASNEQAVQKIFEVKGRPQHNPLILHIGSQDQLSELVQEIPESAKKLMDAFWPGPLTICFEKSTKVSDLVTAGLATVCVRMPDHPIAQELLKAVGQAVAAPSANLSGRPSTTRFKDVRGQLEQERVYFLDGGDTPLGLESTVVDCTGEQVKILRPGSISQSELEQILGDTVLTEDKPEEISSPGQLLSHYAPEGELTVICGSADERRAWIQEHANQDEDTFGLVGPSEELNQTSHQHLSHDEDDLDSYAKNLYAFLNWCDKQHVQQIILELPDSDHPLLPALKNRLEKASKGNIHYL